MYVSNFRNLRHLFSIQIILVLFLTVGSQQQAQGQTKNHPLYDYNQVLHFGFTVGGNLTDVKYELSDDFYRNDSLNSINSQKIPGFTLGIVSNLHVTENFDVRFIPSLSLTERQIDYQFRDGVTKSKKIESVFIEAPLTLKYKSERHHNVRFYVIGGGKYAYDLASEADAEINPFEPIVAVEPHNYYYEFGFGFDLYFEYFKFSPELKLSRGLNNVLADRPSVFSQSFDSFKSTFWLISLQFE